MRQWWHIFAAMIICVSMVLLEKQEMLFKYCYGATGVTVLQIVWNIHWQYQYYRVQQLIICISLDGRSLSHFSGKPCTVWLWCQSTGLNFGVFIYLSRQTWLSLEVLTGPVTARWHPLWHQAYWTNILSLKLKFSQSSHCVWEKRKPKKKKITEAILKLKKNIIIKYYH